jgi:hypothetical protein
MPAFPFARSASTAASTASRDALSEPAVVETPSLMAARTRSSVVAIANASSFRLRRPRWVIAAIRPSPSTASNRSRREGSLLPHERQYPSSRGPASSPQVGQDAGVTEVPSVPTSSVPHVSQKRSPASPTCAHAGQVGKSASVTGA